jgi:endonuclease/exonuclease/phosphatase family metal-dependent hydrolase
MQNMWWLIALWLFASACFAEQFKIVTWNLDWFPGKRPVSTEADRIIHMSAAHDALLDLQPEILCLQEVRDLPAVEKLCEVLPNFQVHIVSRFKEPVGNILGIQQTAICGSVAAEAAWSESWHAGKTEPPRGFSFSAIPTSNRNYLLVYSVHFKSNLGSLTDDIAKREEAARQLLAHETQMEEIYSKNGHVAVVIGGDFNTSPDDPKFSMEQTFSLLLNKFSWCWNGVPAANRVTVPGHGLYRDATFDGFFVKGCDIVSVAVVDTGSTSDHRPVSMVVAVR